MAAHPADDWANETRLGITAYKDDAPAWLRDAPSSRPPRAEVAAPPPYPHGVAPSYVPEPRADSGIAPPASAFAASNAAASATHLRTEATESGPAALEVLWAEDGQGPEPTPIRAFELGHHVGAHLQDGQVFVPPVVVLEGRLVVAFDDVAVLEAWVDALGATWLTDAMSTHVDAAKRALDAKHVFQPKAHVERLRLAIGQAGAAPFSPSELDEHVERTLLGERRFARRYAFGRPHVLARLETPECDPVPVYVADGAAAVLPSLRATPCRLAAEATARQDAYETCPWALRAVAFARRIGL